MIITAQARHYHDNLLPIVRQMDGPMWGATIDYKSVPAFIPDVSRY